jgi:hypothetical protein
MASKDSQPSQPSQSKDNEPSDMETDTSQNTSTTNNNKDQEDPPLKDNGQYRSTSPIIPYCCSMCGQEGDYESKTLCHLCDQCELCCLTNRNCPSHVVCESPTEYTPQTFLDMSADKHIPSTHQYFTTINASNH